MIFLLACGSSLEDDSAGSKVDDGPCGPGIEVGDCPPDVSLVDQDGASVSLLSYAGTATVIASEASWCEACVDLAEGLEALYLDRQSDGLAIVGVIVQGGDYTAPDGDDAADWADAFGLTHAVLADPEGAFLPAYGGDISNAPFVFYVLNGEGEIIWRALREDGTTLDQISTAVLEVLGD